jgi:hypothetical protein
MQFKVRLCLTRKKSSAIKNGYKDGDIVISINGIALCEIVSEVEIKKIFDAALEDTSEPLRILVDRGGESFFRNLPFKNHGVTYEVIDILKVDKEINDNKLKVAKEIDDKKEIDKALLQFKNDNLNKTVIVSSPSLMQYIVYQYTPEKLDSSTEAQIKQQGKTDTTELFLTQDDIEFEVIFTSVSETKAKGAIELANNKMKAKGYLEIVLSGSQTDNIDKQTNQISLEMRDFIQNIKKGRLYCDRDFVGEKTLTKGPGSKELVFVLDINDNVVTYTGGIGSQKSKKSLYEFAIKYGPRPKFSLGLKRFYQTLFLTTFLFLILIFTFPSFTANIVEQLVKSTVGISIAEQASKSSVETSNYEPVYNTNSYDCKLDALEIAARVKTNIRAGQSDYFYRIDLTEYKRKGCSKSHIMTAVNSL